MNEILSSEFSQRLVLTLLHFMWQGFAIGLLAWLISRMFSDRSAAARHNVFVMAMLTMVLCVPVTFSLVDIESVVYAPGSVLEEDRAAIVSELDAGRDLDAAGTQIESAEIPEDALIVAHPGGEPQSDFESELANAPLDSASQTPLVSANPPAQRFIHQSVSRFAPYATGIYLLGVTLMIMRMLLAFVGGHRLRVRSELIDDKNLRAMVAQLARKMQMRILPKIASCQRLAVPVVVGVIRPMILLPASLASGLTTNELRAILAHEMAHIRRYDLVINLFQRLVETLLFFHPAVWYVSHRISVERENCCDDMAVQVGQGSLPYAEALVRMAEISFASRAVSPGIATLSATGITPSQFKRRVVRLMQVSEKQRVGMAAPILLVAISCLLTIIALGAIAQDKSQIDDETPIVAKDGDQNPVAANETDDAKARRIALAAHKKAAAINKLMQFYYRARVRNGNVDTMRNEKNPSVEDYIKALDEPVIDKHWVNHTNTFAWSDENMFKEEHMLDGTGRDAKRTHHDYRWLNKNDAWERLSLAGQPPNFVRLKSSQRLWKGLGFFNYGYLRQTPRTFPWGTMAHVDQTVNPVPPEESSWKLLPPEEFGDEMCDVVLSTVRRERLWISRKHGHVRAILRYQKTGPFVKFITLPLVEEIAGRKFADRAEYTNWYHGEASNDQLAKLTVAWYKVVAEEFDTNSQPTELLRFSDYREALPGIWIPFREDRAIDYQSEINKGNRSFTRFELVVEKVSDEFDFEQTVAELNPKAGEQVQDQRFFDAPVNFEFSDEMTDDKIRELAAARREEMEQGQRKIDELTAPFNDLVGKNAPAFPMEGWIGDQPDTGGKPYLIHFWAAWCAPCKNDFKALKVNAENGMKVIGVHPAGAGLDEIKRVMEEHELNYPTLVARKADDGLVAGFPNKVYPYTVIVDVDGKVRAHGQLHQVMLKYPAREPETIEEREAKTAQKTVEDEKDEDSRWPEHFKGEVSDKDGKPLVGAKVKIQLASYFRVESRDEGQKLLATTTATTDENGKYAADTAGFPAPIDGHPWCVTVTASADGYAPGQTWWFFSDSNEKFSETKPFGKLKLPLGKVVKGRCLDADGKPIADARVTGSARKTVPGGRISPTRTNVNGNFEVIAPKSEPIELWFASAAAGNAHTLVPADETKVEIKFPRATSLSGRVLALDGSPVVNTVVVIKKHDDVEIKAHNVKEVNFATKTDADGKFRLPPANGTFLCFVAEAYGSDELHYDETRGASLFAGRPAPTVVPQKAELTGDKAEQTITLQEVETVEAFGQVFNKDDSTRLGTKIQAWMSTDTSVIYVFDSSTTNMEGKYRLRLPIGATNVRIVLYPDANNRNLEPVDEDRQELAIVTADSVREPIDFREQEEQ